MTEDSPCRVHLFRGNFLIANLATLTDKPADSYEIDGVRYDVVSIREPHLERDGGTGWDVQVTPHASRSD